MSSTIHAPAVGALAFAFAVAVLLHLVVAHPSPPDVHHPHFSSSSSSSSRALFRNRPSPRLIKALARVHALQSANICQAKSIALKPRKHCPPFSRRSLSRAISRLELEALRDRQRRRLQRPLYRTFILEPFEGVVDTTILFLHPYSGNARQFVELIYPALRRKGFLPRTRIIMPQARPMYDPFFNRSDAPSWYNIISDFANWNGHDVYAAAGNVASVLDVACTLLGAPRERAGVTGFSQGAGLSVVVYLRYQVAAAASVVGFLPVPESYPNEMTSISKDSPILFINTDTDEFVPISLVRLSVQYLKRLGRKVDFVELKGLPHNLGNQIVPNVERMFSFVYEEIAKLPGAKSNKTVSVNINKDPVVWELK